MSAWIVQVGFLHSKVIIGEISIITYSEFLSLLVLWRPAVKIQTLAIVYQE